MGRGGKSLKVRTRAARGWKTQFEVKHLWKLRSGREQRPRALKKTGISLTSGRTRSRLHFHISLFTWKQILGRVEARGGRSVGRSGSPNRDYNSYFLWLLGSRRSFLPPNHFQPISSLNTILPPLFTSLAGPISFKQTTNQT